MAIFSQSYDPSVYGKFEFPLEKVNKYIEDYKAKHNVKLSYTTLFCKMAAQAIERNPDYNVTIKCGKIVPRDTIDISVLVNVDGKVKFLLIHL